MTILTDEQAAQICDFIVNPESFCANQPCTPSDEVPDGIACRYKQEKLLALLNPVASEPENKLETPKEVATKIYLDVCERVEKDGFIAKGFIQTYTEELTTRDALLRSDERQKAAERAENYLRKQWCRWTYSSLRAALLAEPEEAQG